MSDKRDYYEVLGVDRDADQRTIKRAFLKKAREVHPDVSDDPDAEEKFKEVNEAYSVLSDDQKRANYDRYGTAEGPGMGSGYVDFSDIFGGMGMDDIARLHQDHQLRPPRHLRGLPRHRRGGRGEREDLPALPRHGVRHDRPALHLRPGPVQLPVPRVPRRGDGHRPSLRHVRRAGPHAHP